MVKQPKREAFLLHQSLVAVATPKGADGVTAPYLNLLQTACPGVCISDVEGLMALRRAIDYALGESGEPDEKLVWRLANQCEPVEDAIRALLVSPSPHARSALVREVLRHQYAKD